MATEPGGAGTKWTGDALERAFGYARPEYLFYLMLQATRRREAELAGPLRALGLAIGKWRALMAIRRTGACTMSELAQLSPVDRTTLSRTVDQLVQDGLVRREASPLDRRAVHLSLTPEGLRLAEAGAQCSQAVQRRAMKGVSEEQLAEAVRVLQRVVDNMIPEDDVAYGVLTFQRTSRKAPRRE